MATKQAKKLHYTVIYEPRPNGGFTVTVPAIPECEAEGSTLDVARARAKNAIEGCILEMLDEGDAIPVDVGREPVFEKITVSVKGKQFTYMVLFEPSYEGGFTIVVPALPGCVSEAESLLEARANISDAIEGYLECQLDLKKPIPKDLQAQPLFEKITAAIPALAA